MTRDEILNMPAGREMDMSISEKVMGLKWDETRCRVCGWPLEDDRSRGCVKDDCSMRPRPYPQADEPAPYSANIFSAWQVVEMLCNETGCDVVKVCKRDPELLRGDWSCNFGRGFEAFGDTAPLAICRAALLAVLTGAE